MPTVAIYVAPCGELHLDPSHQRRLSQIMLEKLGYCQATLQGPSGSRNSAVGTVKSRMDAEQLLASLRTDSVFKDCSFRIYEHQFDQYDEVYFPDPPEDLLPR